MKPFTCDSQVYNVWSRSRPITFGVLACLLFGGCGRESDSLVRAPVSGTVFVSGKPLTSGVVRFVPIGETDGPVTTATVDDGCYSLAAEAGPVAGKYQVEIAATNFLGFDLGNQEAAEQAIRRHGRSLPRNPVPIRYQRNSPLRAEIPQQGRNTLDFAIGFGRSKS